MFDFSVDLWHHQYPNGVNENIAVNNYKFYTSQFEFQLVVAFSIYLYSTKEIWDRPFDSSTPQTTLTYRSVNFIPLRSLEPFGSFFNSTAFHFR